ncbi:hypothetical protein SAMN04487948_103304 [Halogranum amylolyticum]|uniref:DUF7351 domain-containing protein n=2 Tax=Halogranum amylolyticum TaxID=660520 RepID=A0A1H8QTA9_9EURY|nr:hypothetical protein SAMN04487948_103304 [Halogranum amylolyticum]
MWDHVTVKFSCERCGQTLHSDVATSLLDYPDTIAFARTHGVDVRETAIWELPLVTNDETTVTAEPFRVRVTYPLDGDELTFVVDEEFTIVDVSGESDRYDT